MGHALHHLVIAGADARAVAECPQLFDHVDRVLAGERGKRRPRGLRRNGCGIRVWTASVRTVESIDLKDKTINQVEKLETGLSFFTFCF